MAGALVQAFYLSTCWTCSRPSSQVCSLASCRDSWSCYVHLQCYYYIHKLYCTLNFRVAKPTEANSVLLKHHTLFCSNRYLVSQGVIRPLCDLLTVMDSKIVQVALSGLENILRVGKQDGFQNDGINQFAVMVEEAYGRSRNTALHNVTQHY